MGPILWVTTTIRHKCEPFTILDFWRTSQIVRQVGLGIGLNMTTCLTLCARFCRAQLINSISSLCSILKESLSNLPASKKKAISYAQFLCSDWVVPNPSSSSASSTSSSSHLATASTETGGGGGGAGGGGGGEKGEGGIFYDPLMLDDPTLTTGRAFQCVFVRMRART